MNAPLPETPKARTTPPRLPDARLIRRRALIVGQLVEKPGAPIPEAMGSDAATEGCYRFIENGRVTVAAVLEPHRQETAQAPIQGARIAVHDTTGIQHLDALLAPDMYKLGGGAIGYYAHFSILLDEVGGRPVGVTHLEVVERQRAQKGKKKPKRPPKDGTPDRYRRTRESERWERGVSETIALFGAEVPLIHVFDSEGDAFELMAHLRAGDHPQDFVIRAGQTRRLSRPEPEPGHILLEDYLLDLPEFYGTKVKVSARKGKGALKTGKGNRNRKPRKARQAKVVVRAGPATMLRPKNAPKDWIPCLELNLVQVVEQDVPEGEEPLEWILWTTLPVDTVEQIQRVIRIYLCRWRIEEFFKALKTGCQFEKRRFETRATSSRALALYVPAAVQLLGLRALSREEPLRPAEEILPRHYLQALRHLNPKLPLNPTVQEAMLAVAEVGGHRKSNGPPGWLVLGRGMLTLHAVATGWLAAERALAAATTAPLGDVIT